MYIHSIKSASKAHAMQSLLKNRWSSNEEAAMVFDLLMQAKTEKAVDKVAKKHKLVLEDHLSRLDYTWAQTTCYLLDLAGTQHEMVNAGLVV